MTPTEAERTLVIVAGYESQLRIHSVGARRHFHTVGILSSIAALVFVYDVLSVVASR